MFQTRSEELRQVRGHLELPSLQLSEARHPPVLPTALPYLGPCFLVSKSQGVPPPSELFACGDGIGPRKMLAQLWVTENILIVSFQFNSCGKCVGFELFKITLWLSNFVLSFF